MISKRLRKHLAVTNKISPFATYLKEIIYGGNDGIVTTFAIIAGFAGAQQMNNPTLPIVAVLLFGGANLLSDGASMGLGNFLSVRSEKEVYASEKAKELAEIHANPMMEKEETTRILLRKGFTKTQAAELSSIYATNESFWTEFMMNDELKISNPEEENPIFTGLVTFLSFVIFGIIPLLPYILLQNKQDLFGISIAFTVVSLLLLGFLRWVVTKEYIVKSIGEILLVGSVSAVLAYIVGLFFR